MTHGSLTHRHEGLPGAPEDGATAHRADVPTASVFFSLRSNLPSSEAAAPGGPSRYAWLRQIHSGTVLRARPGLVGEADALWTGDEGLGLLVVSADCVPVLIASADAVAAIHAGWRGLCAGVVPAALDRLLPLDETATAWVGPAIGPCCYEVGETVATRVAAASSADVVVDRNRGRPHLDLPRAAYEQLERAGLADIRLLRRCTRCDSSLASFRRDGRQSGRNYSIIWRRRGAPEGSRPKARS